jgi:hypothetical protein
MRISAWTMVGVLLAVPCGLIFADQAPQDRLSNQVRHQLVTLPYFSVFDDLSYRVDDGARSLCSAKLHGRFSRAKRKAC